VPHQERAAEKVFSELGKLRALKAARAEAGRETKIVVAGCVAQAEGEEIFKRQKAVDIIVGPQSYHRLPELLQRAQTSRAVLDTDFPAESKFDHLAAPGLTEIRKRGVSAFVTVQEGCDKFCTFCVVPYTRGAEVSRPVEGIVAEVEMLAAGGVREVSLLGQNVNAYHGERGKAPPLRWQLSSPGSPKCQALPVSATPRAIRATWTQVSSKHIAINPP